MNTHTLERASPPTKRAGPKLLAGLTDVPVNEMPRICTSVNVRPITMPATPEVETFDVTPRIVKATIGSQTERRTNLDIEAHENQWVVSLCEHLACGTAFVVKNKYDD